jgi:hypothetical protein
MPGQGRSGVPVPGALDRWAVTTPARWAGFCHVYLGWTPTRPLRAGLSKTARSSGPRVLRRCLEGYVPSQL